jgi:hypothetical protein
MRSVSAIAAEVTPRSAARKIRAHDEFRADQAGGAGDRADAGQGAQFAFDGSGVFGEQRAVLAGQHQHVLLARAAEADLDLDAGQHLQRLAQLPLDLLLPDTPDVPRAASC